MFHEWIDDSRLHLRDMYIFNQQHSMFVLN